MTTESDLKDIISKMKLQTPFRGVFMRNELKDIEPLENECLILNLNDTTVTVEENTKTGHWCALFKDGPYKYWFCSYGSPIPTEVVKYLGMPILYHNFVIQSFNSAICGEMCCLFIYFMDNNLSYFDAVLELLEMFQDD